MAEKALGEELSAHPVLKGRGPLAEVRVRFRLVVLGLSPIQRSVFISLHYVL